MSAALKDAAVLSWALASSRKRLFRSVQLSSGCLSFGGIDKVGFPVTKPGSEFHNPGPLADIDTPGKQAPALAIPGLPPPAFVGAAYMVVAGIAELSAA